MDFPDLLLWFMLALAYALAAVGLQRLLVRFIDPYRRRARSPAEQT